MASLFSCYHRTTGTPRATSPTYPHPCFKCMHLAADQQQETIKGRYFRQQQVLTTSIAEANKAAIAAKEKEMREFREDETGWEDRHRVTAAEIERRMREISRAKGELGDLKRREKEEVDEAWREHEKLWPTLSKMFPGRERELGDRSPF